MADESTKPEEAAKAGKLGGMMTAVKAIAFVSIIVMLEMTAASMLIPSAEETQVIGEQLAAAKKADEIAEENPENQAATEATVLGDMVEVDLRSHHVLSYNPDTGTSLNVDFELWATVLKDEEAEFNKLYATNQQRINEQVNITVRGLGVTDFTDPQAGLLKRAILEKTNRALGKPLLHDVLLVDFSFVER